MTDQFLVDQVAKIEDQINDLNEAITFLYANPHKSYTLDSGQTRTTVTRNDIDELNNLIDKLLNRRSTLLTRINGSVSLIEPYY